MGCDVSALKVRFSEKKKKFALMHRHVPGACWGVAFYLTQMPREDQRLLSEMAVLVDGTRPLDDEPIYCGTCGQGMVRFNVSDIEPVQ